MLIIKTCPNCKTAGHFDVEHNQVICKSCGMRGPVGKTIQEAIEKWDNLPRQYHIKAYIRKKDDLNNPMIANREELVVEIGDYLFVYKPKYISPPLEIVLDFLNNGEER